MKVKTVTRNVGGWHKAVAVAIPIPSYEGQDFTAPTEWQVVYFVAIPIPSYEGQD